MIYDLWALKKLQKNVVHLFLKVKNLLPFISHSLVKIMFLNIKALRT